MTIECGHSREAHEVLSARLERGFAFSKPTLPQRKTLAARQLVVVV